MAQDVTATARDGLSQASVAAANRLTARWAGSCGGGPTVLSGVGLWPLLAALADPAGGPARSELAEAVGLPAQDGLGAAHELLRALEQSPAVHCALGLWTAARLPVRTDWASRMPAAVHGILDQDPPRAQAALDAWVEKQTEGLLRRLPVSIRPSTLLVLASALTVRTQWEHPFTPMPLHPAEGPWARRKLSGLRRPNAVSGIRLAASDGEHGCGPVTLALVRGREEIDVVLALGEADAPAGGVLATAVAACGPQPQPQPPSPSSPAVRIDPVDLERGRPGPGLAVTWVQTRDPVPGASLHTVAFTVGAHHDLLDRAELFGLRAASTRDTAGRFPGISSLPLYVEAAAQDATATFSAKGFVAAAVTAVSLMKPMAMMHRPIQTAPHLTASFDRPFGFVAVHRPTGLVLVCGWVTDPDDYPR